MFIIFFIVITYNKSSYASIIPDLLLSRKNYRKSTQILQKTNILTYI